MRVSKYFSLDPSGGRHTEDKLSILVGDTLREIDVTCDPLTLDVAELCTENGNAVVALEAEAEVVSGSGESCESLCQNLWDGEAGLVFYLGLPIGSFLREC